MEATNWMDIPHYEAVVFKRM